MWFDVRRGSLQYVFVVLLFLFAGGGYLYVWSDFLPRWYDGRLCIRFGLLVPNGVRSLL